MDSSALRADRVVLGGRRRPDERAGAAARGGRRRTQRGVELPRFAFAAGVSAHRRGVRRVRLRQCRDGGARGRSAPWRRGTHLLRRAGQAVRGGHQARPARAGLLGRSADRRGLAESRRQGRLRPGVPLRQPGRGVVAGVGRRAARHHRQDAGTAGHPRLCRRLGRADRRSVRGGQRRHRASHRVDRRGDRADVADRLPLAGHDDPGAHHGAHRDGGRPRDRLVPGERRGHWPVDVFDEHPHAVGDRGRNRLRHLLARPLSRETQRGHGPRGRLLRHVPRDRACDPRVRG